MNIIGNRKIFLFISGALMTLSLFPVLFFGFKQGIDFQGGTLLNLEIPGNVTPQNLETFFRDKLSSNVTVISGSQDDFLIRLEAISEDNHQSYIKQLIQEFPGVKELSFQSIGPTIGKELQKSSMLALVFVLLGISAYIAFAFRKASRPVSSWKYGVVTLISLLHDIVIPAGLVAFLGRTHGMEIDTNFIVALLVIMGFSVHDTIVVFDRIRENLIHPPAHIMQKGGGNVKDKYNFSAIVNTSINETFARSLNTSLTLIVVLVALLLFGPVTLTNFVLILLVGVTSGTYSSIFVASPLLTLWHDLSKKGR
ncbi:MAG: protein translocase subunit SecF [bacterium]|nr:protein translocase subunit SecF [bacterium]